FPKHVCLPIGAGFLSGHADFFAVFHHIGMLSCLISNRTPTPGPVTLTTSLGMFVHAAIPGLL
ncbi:hypothetical protein BDZ89DRAFT_1065244, partial [Hymenopellis radicata]